MDIETVVSASITPLTVVNTETLCFADGADTRFDVVIYVPSARGNFDQRTAVRQTWLGHVSQNETLQNRFALPLLSAHF